jgi:drug/metabolite transporter (DMT)-like permease
MRSRDLTDLLLLAAIWGASFLFMRVAAPQFGPVALAWVRVAGAALLLLPLLAWRGEMAALRQHWRPIALVGLLTSALPFLLFGYAALTLSAGLASIFNAATPLFTALVAWLWHRDTLNRWRSTGLGLGLAGVIGLAAQRSGLAALQGALDLPAALAVLACLAATLLYGLAANLARTYLQGAAPMAQAAGSQLAAALVLSAPAVWLWPADSPGTVAWLSALGLAVLCSAIGYILYFRLIARTGATNAAAVTFLIPVFALVWGGWLLDETVTAAMVAGGLVIVAGTAMVLGLLPRRT